jgi:hypothetical protein
LCALLGGDGTVSQTGQDLTGLRHGFSHLSERGKGGLQNTLDAAQLFIHRGYASDIRTHRRRHGKRATIVTRVSDAETGGNALLNAAERGISVVEGLQGKDGLTVGIDRVQRHWGLPLSIDARSTQSSDCQIAIRFLRRTFFMHRRWLIKTKWKTKKLKPDQFFLSKA